MAHVVIGRYFSLFLKGLKIFLNPRRSLTVPLTDFKFSPKILEMCDFDGFFLF